MANQYVVPHLHAFVSQQHDPLALTTFPESDQFLITSIAQLDPREMPTFDEVRKELIHMDSLLNSDETSNELAEATNEMHLGEESGSGSSKARGTETREEEEGEEEEEKQNILPVFKPPKLKGWEVELPNSSKLGGARLLCTAMTCDGRVIVGVGTRSTIWIWRLQTDS